MGQLLTDPTLFGSVENMRGCMNVDSDSIIARFKPYVPSRPGFVDEVHDASWYQSTCQYAIDNFGNTNWIVIPIMMYLDKTGTDSLMRYGLEPLMFTTTLLNRSTRNHPSAWRPLGFIPDLDSLKSSASKSKARMNLAGKGRSARNYHHCLQVLLKAHYKDRVRWTSPGIDGIL